MTLQYTLSLIPMRTVQSENAARDISGPMRDDLSVGNSCKSASSPAGDLARKAGNPRPWSKVKSLIDKELPFWVIFHHTH